MQKPNLLFVFADQMRGFDIGCAGNAQVQTPALDRLAREGVLCSRHYATVPVCGPNRAVMLTGTYPTRNCAVGNDLPLPIGMPTLGTLLKAEGYATGYVGKWHLDGLPRDKWTPPGPRRFGFDFWAAFNCSHEYFNARYFRDTPELIRREGYEPEVQTDLALEFLNDRTANEPFALVLSWGPPHNPYDEVPSQFRDAYDPDEIRLRQNVVEETVNPLAVGLECRRTTADYYAAITALDAQFARLLKWLDENGQAENTIVVFTSDHGDMLWSHGLMQKQLPYEEAIHVPLILRWPAKLAQGGVLAAPNATVDLLPTLLGLMEIAIPSSIQGRDLSTLLQSGEERPVVTASQNDTKNDAANGGVLLANYLVSDQAKAQQVPEWRGVRTLRYTYVEKYSADGGAGSGRRPWLLFDNETDPYQQTNLIESPEYRRVQQTLRERLQALLQECGDDFDGAEALLSRCGLLEAWAQREAEMQSA
jgi:arylsulfatase A-like enzyme